MAIFRYSLLIYTVLIAMSCSDGKNQEQDLAVLSDSLANNSNQSDIAATSNLLQIDIPVDDIVPAEFTKDDIASLASTGKAPFVINFRQALNDYYKGKAESPYFERSALIAVGDNLTTFDKSYYKSKFFILKVNTDYPVGGVFMDILFRNKPDKVFTVWMFETEGIFKLRMFEQNLDYSASEIKGTLKMFENVFKREELAF